MPLIITLSSACSRRVETRETAERVVFAARLQLARFALPGKHPTRSVLSAQITPAASWQLAPAAG
jgi:hypothetical protein